MDYCRSANRLATVSILNGANGTTVDLGSLATGSNVVTVRISFNPRLSLAILL
jgi:hypothetical protein